MAPWRGTHNSPDYMQTDAPPMAQNPKTHENTTRTSRDQPAIHVLLVESDPQFARSLRQILAASTTSPIELVQCERLDQALEHRAVASGAAVLVDLELPDSRGLDIILKLQSRASHLPVILLADFENETLALRAVREGAQDYLVKSKLEGRFLSRVIRYAIERKETERRLSTQCAVTRALAESVSPPEAAQRILAAAGEGLGWETGAFWTSDPAERVLRAIAVWRSHGSSNAGVAEKLHEIPLNDPGFFGQIWKRGEPAWSVDPGDIDEPCRHAARLSGQMTVVGVPVAIHQRILGVMGFFALGARPLDRVLLQMMATAGGQIGQFLLRKQAESTLAEERNLLRTLIDTLPDPIYVKDVESRFVLANARVAQLMGVRRVEDLYGRKDSDFFPPALAERYYADERIVLDSGRALINQEEPYQEATGLRGWLLTTKAPLRDLQGRLVGLVGIGRDITERKRVESQLVEAEKFKSIGTLAAGVAHEVKNPLQTILMGMTYLDRWASGANGETRMVITEIRDAIRRADAIIRGLVEFSAANQPEMRQESLNAIIERSLALVRYQLTRSQVIVMREFDNSLPPLLLDRNKFEQAMINLFLNAIQAMPDGGTLTVRTCSRPPRDRHPQSHPPPMVVAEVEDSGAGIPEALMARIFDPFYTTKPTGLGTGLGLSVTRKLIEAHGGAIAATNRPGGGARFTITLNPEPETEYEKETRIDRRR
jgi:PAS domain S-box-containing protein